MRNTNTAKNTFGNPLASWLNEMAEKAGEEAPGVNGKAGGCEMAEGTKDGAPPTSGAGIESGRSAYGKGVIEAVHGAPGGG